MSANSPTTIAAYAMAIRKALEANGCDAREVFSRAGVKYTATVDPNERLTTAQVATLFEYSEKATGNPAFGLTVGRFIHPSFLYALGYSLLASSTLRDCCERLVHYFHLASEQADVEITEEGECFYLSTKLITAGVSNGTLDAWHAFLIRLFRLIYLPDFKPMSVSLQRPCPKGYEEFYLKSFGVPVTFDAEVSVICIDRALVDEPLLGGNRVLAQQNDRVIDEYLAAQEHADIECRVRNHIVQSLSSGSCSKQRVAAEMCMSPSTLQQKLGQLDTTFQDVLNQVRESLARSYMEQSSITITEVSFMLGFTDTSSFTRAFRRWTDKSPSDYRKELGLD